MLTKTPITVYNRYKDGKKTCWLRTNLREAKWEQSTASVVSTSGLEASDKLKAMIWFNVDSGGKSFLDPKEFNSLSIVEAKNYWTLEQNDVLFKGEISDEVREVISELLDKYANKMTLKSVKIVDYGRAHMHKWEVTGA